MARVVFVQNVFDRGIPIHKEGEQADLEGAALDRAIRRGWAAEVTAEKKDGAAAGGEKKGGEKKDGKK